MSLAINWVDLTVSHSYLSADVKIVDPVITYVRNKNAGRKVDTSYTIERAFLDYIGETRFIHKTFRFVLFGNNKPFYIQFTADEVILGLSIRHR